ncbi:hypothetical protein GJ496_007764 [Pomphorhynchus laevis]|nr:hypothetical protein GJ496_007764 [Pomphorhynchus laevis]
MQRFLPVIVKPTWITRISEKLGFQGRYTYPQNTMQISAKCMYAIMSEIVDHKELMSFCHLPDKFSSYAHVIFLHTYLLSHRLASASGQSGRFTRNELIKFMWNDLAVRAKLLGTSSASLRRQQLNELSDQFRATVIGYDEGCLGSDAQLAASIYRHLLRCSETNWDDNVKELLQILLVMVRYLFLKVNSKHQA